MKRETRSSDWPLSPSPGQAVSKFSRFKFVQATQLFNISTCSFFLLLAVLLVSHETPQQVRGQELQDVGDTVQILRDIEARVLNVVEQNSAAVVGISDGVGAGSGVIVNDTGLILTAGHVMESDGPYTILFPDGRTANAKPLGKNLDVDSGMIQITDEGKWPAVKLGASDKLRKGDWVVSLGHSGGFELGRTPPVRTGRLLDRNDYQLMTDAVLIGGDSGGPLFNLDGELIAIHSSIGDSVAENRHVKLEIFERDWNRLYRSDRWGQLPELNDPGEKKDPPKIGVSIDRVTAQIKSVKLNSPASDVGIEPGDVVVQFDDQVIESGAQLIDLVRQKIVGDVSRITVIRNGNRLEFEIRLR
jgi:serine protease Do